MSRTKLPACQAAPPAPRPPTIPVAVKTKTRGPAGALARGFYASFPKLKYCYQKCISRIVTQICFLLQAAFFCREDYGAEQKPRSFLPVGPNRSGVRHGGKRGNQRGGLLAWLRRRRPARPLILSHYICSSPHLAPTREIPPSV